MGALYSRFVWSGYTSRSTTHSSVEELSDNDLYTLIEAAIASDKTLGNPATLDPLMCPTAWRIAPEAAVKICYLTEPFMMSYVSENTSIPIPKVRRVLPLKSSSDKPPRFYLVTDYVEGDILAMAWPKLSWWARFRVIWYMRSYIRQLHALPLPFPDVAGSVDASGTPYKSDGFFFTENGAGPFHSYTALADFYDQRRFNHLVITHRRRGRLITDVPKFDRTQPLVVCHGDLHMNNIILARDSGVPWLIDWGSAGMFPAWLDYASLVVWGMPNMHRVPKFWIWSAWFIVGRYDWYYAHYLMRNATDSSCRNEPSNYFTDLGIDID